METLISFIPLLLFVVLIFFIIRRGNPQQLESMNKATESNERLVEAVNRLADVIAKK